MQEDHYFKLIQKVLMLKSFWCTSRIIQIDKEPKNMHVVAIRKATFSLLTRKENDFSCDKFASFMP